MIKLTSYKRGSGNKADVVLFADTKSEVTEGMVVVGLPENTELDFGSAVITASGDVGFLKSDNTWSWVGED